MQGNQPIPCPKCASRTIATSGFSSSARQRYFCQACRYTYSRDHIYIQGKKAPALKRKALKLYRDGMAIRPAAKAVGVSRTTVWKWVHAAGVNSFESHTQTKKMQ